MKILAVEDDPVALAVLRQALRRLGHDCIEASDGQTAWERLQAEPVRVVVSDWLMPRVDGLELCRRIRGQVGTEYTYFSLLTGNDATADNQRSAADAGVDDFLTVQAQDDPQPEPRDARGWETIPSSAPVWAVEPAEPR